MVFICSVCGCDIAVERKQGYIIEVTDGNFYWFGGHGGKGVHSSARFIYHLRKNKMLNYTKIHRIFDDGSVREVPPDLYKRLERYITDYFKYLQFLKEVGYSQGSKKPDYHPTIQAV